MINFSRLDAPRAEPRAGDGGAMNGFAGKHGFLRLATDGPLAQSEYLEDNETLTPIRRLYT